MSQEGGEPVVVDTEEVHGIDDARQGMRPAFLALVGLLAVVTRPGRDPGPHRVADRLRQLAAVSYARRGERRSGSER